MFIVSFFMCLFIPDWNSVPEAAKPGRWTSAGAAAGLLCEWQCYPQQSHAQALRQQATNLAIDVWMLGKYWNLCFMIPIQVNFNLYCCHFHSHSHSHYNCHIFLRVITGGSPSVIWSEFFIRSAPTSEWWLVLDLCIHDPAQGESAIDTQQWRRCWAERHYTDRRVPSHREQWPHSWSQTSVRTAPRVRSLACISDRPLPHHAAAGPSGPPGSRGYRAQVPGSLLPRNSAWIC